MWVLRLSEDKKVCLDIVVWADGWVRLWSYEWFFSVPFKGCKWCVYFVVCVTVSPFIVWFMSGLRSIYVYDGQIIGGIEPTASVILKQPFGCRSALLIVSFPARAVRCRLLTVLSVYLCRLSHLTDAPVMTVPLFSFISSHHPTLTPSGPELPQLWIFPIFLLLLLLP